jgi:hypothetical protein
VGVRFGGAAKVGVGRLGGDLRGGGDENVRFGGVVPDADRFSLEEE